MVAQLLRGQAAAGHDVTLIYSPTRSDAIFMKEICSIKPLEIITLPMRREVGLHDVWAGARLLWILGRHSQFDVIHSHCSKAGALARTAGIFFPRTVKVHSPHSFHSMFLRASRLYGWLERRFAGLSDAIIAVSPLEKRFGVDKVGIPSSKMTVIRNGIEPIVAADGNEARKRIGCDDDDYVVGFVGRLVEVKNPARLADAFGIIAKDLPNARLAVVGEGELRGELEQRLERLGVMDRAIFLSDRNAMEFMAGFDCLLCTSDYESFALIFPEAMASGVPAVSPPVGISEEMIIDGKTGYVADFSPEGLARAVLKLAALSAPDRARMAEDCRRQAAKFDVGAMVAETTGLYNALRSRKDARDNG